MATALAGGYGVWGNSTYLGVYGTGTTYGVYGAAGSSGYGVTGTSGNIGVYGSGNSYGLYGSGGTYGAYANGTSYGVYGNSSGGSGLRGVSSTGYGVYGSSGYLGVYGIGDSYGVYGYSASNYGVYGTSGYLGVYGTGTSYGVYGYSSGGYGATGISSSNYGVYGESGSGNGGRFYSASGYGLWAATGRADNSWAGVFDGNVYCYNAYQTSDRNLKKNIKEFGDAMSIINKLKPKDYEFSTEGKLAALNLPRGHHYGLIAQDVELVLPELVKESVHDLNFANTRKAIMPAGDGKEPAAIQKEGGQTETKDNITIKAVNYTELIPIIVKGMQELYADKDKKINDLQQQINELKAMVEALSKQPGNTTSFSTAFLKQNAPNPVNNNTVIGYYLPDNTTRAQIRITDAMGKSLKVYSISKGEGQINVNSGELPAGAYSYTLYVNDKKIDTKQMVITK